MTTKQRTWASEHDWFIAEIPQGVIVREYGESGNLIDRVFTCYRALRAWAGY